MFVCAGTTIFHKTIILGSKNCHYVLQIFMKYKIEPAEYSVSHNYI